MTVLLELSFQSLFTNILVFVIDIFGLVGTVLIGLVLFQKDMRSSYNYNLLGLCISDGMLLIISLIWCFDNIGLIDFANIDNIEIEVIKFIWDWICTGGTKYFTVAIAVERYIVVCYPLKARHLITKKRAKVCASCVMIFVILLAIWSYFYSTYLNSNGSFEIYTAIVLHVVPFFGVVFLNLLIFRGLRKSRAQRQTLTESESYEHSITKMLLTVVLVFGVSYSFEFVRRILNYAGYFDLDKYQYYDYMICRLADVFYALNSSVNFIVYYLMGSKFRSKIGEMFRCCCYCKKK